MFSKFTVCVSVCECCFFMITIWRDVLYFNLKQNN